MQIKDTNGKYEFRVDVKRGLVYEKFIGSLKPEDANRYVNDYTTKIIPAIRGKKWTVCCDMTEYRMSNIAEEMAKGLEIKVAAGMVRGVIILDSTIAKMQVTRSAKDTNTEPHVVTSLDDAEAWLKSQGF